MGGGSSTDPRMVIGTDIQNFPVSTVSLALAGKGSIGGCLPIAGYSERVVDLQSHWVGPGTERGGGKLGGSHLYVQLDRWNSVRQGQQAEAFDLGSGSLRDDAPDCGGAHILGKDSSVALSSQLLPSWAQLSPS
jgi:hypothetical protein